MMRIDSTDLTARASVAMSSAQGAEGAGEAERDGDADDRVAASAPSKAQAVITDPNIATKVNVLA
jgi:hypothetical protein